MREYCVRGRLFTWKFERKVTRSGRAWRHFPHVLLPVIIIPWIHVQTAASTPSSLVWQLLSLHCYERYYHTFVATAVTSPTLQLLLSILCYSSTVLVFFYHQWYCCYSTSHLLSCYCPSFVIAGALPTVLLGLSSSIYSLLYFVLFTFVNFVFFSFSVIFYLLIYKCWC